MIFCKLRYPLQITWLKQNILNPLSLKFFWIGTRLTSQNKKRAGDVRFNFVKQLQAIKPRHFKVTNNKTRIRAQDGISGFKRTDE